MVSYLLVVGLVFLPTFVYLRTTQKREMRDGLQRELQFEARRLSEHLAEVAPEHLDEAIAHILRVSTRRVTIVDSAGKVLGESEADLKSLGNHADRPEIRDAFVKPDGIGRAMRRSATTREELYYSAIRFPLGAPARGVVRVAMATAGIGATEAKSASFLTNAGALALSAAVLLSLVAALVVSRPLRRITDAARAFAAGDFGHSIEVEGHDELGEAASALGELAAQLRGRLLASGSDRAALHALLDDLPIGVILYDPKGTPVVINGRAREVCDLTPAQELERARSLIELEDQAPVVERVLRDGFTLEAPLALPWLPDARLRARWISIFAPDGDRQPALVILDDSASERSETLASLVSKVSPLLRESAFRSGEPERGLELAHLADACDTAAPIEYPRPSEVKPVEIGTLCELAGRDLAPLADAQGLTLRFVLDDGSTKVVEAGGRARRAIRQLLGLAMQAAQRGEVITLTGETVETRVRLSLRVRVTVARLGAAAAPVQPLGAEFGNDRDGDPSESWLALPRA